MLQNQLNRLVSFTKYTYRDWLCNNFARCARLHTWSRASGLRWTCSIKRFQVKKIFRSETWNYGLAFTQITYCMYQEQIKKKKSSLLKIFSAKLASEYATVTLNSHSNWNKNLMTSQNQIMTLCMPFLLNYMGKKLYYKSHRANHLKTCSIFLPDFQRIKKLAKQQEKIKMDVIRHKLQFEEQNRSGNKDQQMYYLHRYICIVLISPWQQNMLSNQCHQGEK